MSAEIKNLERALRGRMGEVFREVGLVEHLKTGISDIKSLSGVDGRVIQN